MITPQPQSVGKSASADTGRRRRYHVYQMTGGKCFYCGQPLRLDAEPLSRDWIFLKSPPGRMIVEHKIPTTRGGTDRPENHVPACESCNKSKGALTLEEFRFVRGLRFGNLNFAFPGEQQLSNARDWLCCHSRDHERGLVVHNMPQSAAAYGRGKSPTRKRWAKVRLSK